MKTKSFVFQEYITWILSKYQEIQKQVQLQDVLRIVEVKKNNTGYTSLIIQVIGKASIFECSPVEIVKNDTLLESFSKKEIRLITYLASQEIKKPTYKIYVQEFCNKINKFIFKLGRYGIDKPIIKTANQISLDKELIKNLSSEDAHLIGYTTGVEQILNEHEEKLKANSQHDL